MPFLLETPRLILRAFCDEDLEGFLAYRNDPEVYQYQGWKVPFERIMAIKFIEMMKQTVPGAENEWFQTAVTVKDTHHLIGDVGFCTMKGRHGQALIGFTLSRAYWGKGYAREAVSAVIDYLFGELKLHRVQADCDPKNTSSYRLLERLGFRREAHHLENYWMGAYWADEYIYAILEREWRKSQ